MKLNAAIIGMGIGFKHLEAIQNYKKSKVSIICEKNKNKIKLLKKKFPNIKITKNENDIFKNNEINLVSIASYDDYHYSQILKCIKYDKNILVEKPMCLTEKELKNIYSKLSKNKKIKFICNHVLRTERVFNKFKNKIDGKKIFYIEGDYIWGRKHKLFGWRSKIKNYSLILGAAIHMIDLVFFLTKQKPTSVYANGSDLITRQTSFKKKSFILIMLEYKSGLIVKISANGVADHPHFHELKVFSENQTLFHSSLGTAEIKKNNLKFLNLKYPDKENRKKLIQNFLDTILNKKSKSFVSLKEQFDIMSVCLFAEKSLKLKKKIKIKYL